MTNGERIDFLRDIVEMLRQELRLLGVDMAPTASREDVARQYFNLKRRLVDPRPRNFVRSDSFRVPNEHLDGLLQLEQKFIRGDDVNPHQSRSIRKATYEDGLFNDWGLHHFHLGTTIDADGFVARTGPVLIARVLQDEVHAIDVREHGHDSPPPWFAQELVQIYHASWPGFMERYRLVGVSAASPFSDSDLAMARKAGLQTLTEIAGFGVFGPMGGGQSTARTSISTLRLMDDLFNQAQICERWVVEQEQFLEQEARKSGVMMADCRRYRLDELTPTYFVFTETNSGVRFRAPIDSERA